MSDATELLIRILEHYMNRILSIKDNPDPSLHGNELLKQDLVLNASETKHAIDQLNDPDTHPIHRSVENTKLLCSAIDCYIHDLEEAKKTVENQLGGARLEFSNIDEEIRYAKGKKNDICNKS